jgi:hypothetical protein
VQQPVQTQLHIVRIFIPGEKRLTSEEWVSPLRNKVVERVVFYPRNERTMCVVFAPDPQGSAPDAQCELASTSIVSRAVPPCQLSRSAGVLLPGLLGRGFLTLRCRSGAREVSD